MCVKIKESTDSRVLSLIFFILLKISQRGKAKVIYVQEIELPGLGEKGAELENQT